MRITRQTTVRRRSAMAILLARYIAGEIAEKTWRRISATLDDENVSREDRLAYARYLSEVWYPETNGRMIAKAA